MRIVKICLNVMMLFLVAQTTLLASDTAMPPYGISIIPKPLEMQAGEGLFALTEETRIYVEPATVEMKAIGNYLADLAAPATGFKLVVKSPWFLEPTGIVLKLDASLKDLDDEGYTLVCTEQGVTITAAKPAGIFYGVQTLRQIMPVEIENRQKVEGVAWTVPCVSIRDKPRFKWRGYLLDPARHFRTKEEVKRCIDLLALNKLNVLQLHLTDKEGWRIEIKKYPKLIETGSRQNYSGGTGDNWFYSQADISDIVAYASGRYVTVVPEIEMPGHSSAATISYPELGCGGRPSQVLCVSQEATFEFARDVLDEVMALFPSRYIHVGADEVKPKFWRNCPKCKSLMDQLATTKLPDDVIPYRMASIRAGYDFQEDIGRLQGEFVRRVDAFITSKGRQMTGWDEILESGLKTNSPAVVMAWRGEAAVEGAASQNRDVIVAMYPDYYLNVGKVQLRNTYVYEPVPASLPAGQEKNVIGVQGCIWGEHTPAIQQVEEQSFPRLCAIAETGWTSQNSRNFEDFSSRLVPFCRRLDLLGVHCPKP